MQETSRSSLVVLLVEDDAADAELIAIRLESATRRGEPQEIRLLHASTAREARALLRRERVDAIILDLSLPDTRGLEVVHLVRAAAVGIPVIVLTGVQDEAMAVAALRAGAQDYVLKPPPDGCSLLRIIRYACERQGLIQALDRSLHASAVAERQWRLLAEAGELLAPANRLGRAIERVGRLLVPDVADCFLLVLAGRRTAHGRRLRWRLRGECAPSLRDGLERLIARAGDRPIRSAASSDAIRALLAESGLTGDARPLHVGGRVRGLMVLASAATRRDGNTDEAFANAIADRIDMAMSQARLLRRTLRAVAARDRAVSIVSHDLRNPLSTIQICARALLDPEPTMTQEARQMGDLIQRSATWMQQIVDELLDHAALDAGAMTLRRRPTPVADIMSAVHSLFATVAQAAGIDLVLRSDPALPSIDADAHRLLQALSNLLGNAMKFTPTGGRVDLIVENSSADRRHRRPVAMDPSFLRFSVRDNGPGIRAEDLAHVFDWFWHAPRQGRTGVGLGLAITKGIVEAHRGSVLVESVPGSGSTFSFTIPISAQALITPRAAGVH
jgi:signal transduction histidine kinase